MGEILTNYTKLSPVEAPKTHSDFLEIRDEAAIFKNGISNEWALKLNFDSATSLLPNEDVTLSWSLQNDDLQAPCKLHDFLEYCEGKRDLTIQCTDGPTGEISTRTFSEDPLYLFQMNVEHRDLLKRFVTCPEFLGDWFDKYMPAFKELVVYGNMHTWFFIGPKGTKSEMHTDHDGVHTTIQQLDGVKRFFLLGPGDFERVSGAIGKRLNLVNFDIEGEHCRVSAEGTDEGLEIFDSVNILTGDIKKHELVYLPRNWGHYAKSLTPSLSVSRDFIDDRNIDNYFFDSIFTSEQFEGMKHSVPFYKIAREMSKHSF
jgi:hypothetical protein